MKTTLRLVLFAVLVGPLSLTVYAGDQGLDLINYMRSLQYFAHKTHLSLEAGNRDLASFYAHEIDEVIEALEQVESYDEQPIGQLAKAILVPPDEAFESAMRHESLEVAAVRFAELIQACNACHKAARHGVISIQMSSANPYMQSFAPVAQ